ncbi:hypothetical protein [Streptomyces venezuelae]|nr:hypothetical protein [Streptomyces venezuelae]
MTLIRAALHSLFPALHRWAEAVGGPLRWTCAGCGAQRHELP